MHTQVGNDLYVVNYKCRLSINMEDKVVSLLSLKCFCSLRSRRVEACNLLDFE